MEVREQILANTLHFMHTVCVGVYVCMHRRLGNEGKVKTEVCSWWKYSRGHDKDVEPGR